MSNLCLHIGMKTISGLDVQNDWKMITLQIGSKSAAFEHRERRVNKVAHFY